MAYRLWNFCVEHWNCLDGIRRRLCDAVVVPGAGWFWGSQLRDHQPEPDLGHFHGHKTQQRADDFLRGPAGRGGPWLFDRRRNLGDMGMETCVYLGGGAGPGGGARTVALCGSAARPGGTTSRPNSAETRA